ncbi:hypothetical protein [Burkholderia territorii]|uniref:hypothetical protein n=1 Tax=Burkholderia territorii TaxID=1503055 RepID=UPI0014792C1A|nr:hypothetical protein [Burkholderia territorii]
MFVTDDAIRRAAACLPVDEHAERIRAALPGEAERYVVHIERALNAARGSDAPYTVRAGGLQLRHVNRCTCADTRGLAKASVRRTAKVLEHDGCALLSFAPCRACPMRRQVARRSPPTARRALECAEPRVACRCHVFFDDGATFGILRKPYRSRQPIHISQHRLAELRDSFAHRRFFE